MFTINFNYLSANTLLPALLQSSSLVSSVIYKKFDVIQE